MFALSISLWCLSLFVCESRGRSAVYQDGDVFLENILLFYGENSSIPTAKLEDLLLLISARRSEAVSDVDNPLGDQEVRPRIY